jgi:predicted regulator of Ras-like GTPase activity (Roadblock/LC7/MglB family)
MSGRATRTSSTGMPAVLANEALRDLDETPFTGVLRSLLRTVPEALLAVFVDEEGECIDYCSVLAPYEAKVAGAQLHVVMHEISAVLARLRAGKSWFLHVQAETRELLVRRVSDEYVLVVVTRPTPVEGPLRAALDSTVAALRAEGEIARPAWEPHRPSLRVDVREALGWGYAPLVFYDRGVRTEITAVLGRFGEGDGRGRRDLFLVRTEHGEELTLAHRPSDGVWERR